MISKEKTERDALMHAIETLTDIHYSFQQSNIVMSNAAGKMMDELTTLLNNIPKDS